MTHAVGDRKRPAGQPGAGTARHERHARCRAQACTAAATLVGAAGEDDQRRDHPVVGEAVALVRPQFLPVGEHPVGADGVTQPLGQCVDPGHHGEPPCSPPTYPTLNAGLLAFQNHKVTGAT